MDEICRICCSKNFVNNYIFDEDSALHLKMTAYIPIKVFKDDKLPQKVCDKCSCKVNDFYQFCNEAVEVQNRLRSTLLPLEVSTSHTVDLTIVKKSPDSPTPLEYMLTHTHQETQTDISLIIDTIQQQHQLITQKYNKDVEIKQESGSVLPVHVKVEHTEETQPDHNFPDFHSDSSDDVSLVDLKKKKAKTKKKSQENGGVKKSKKTRKQKFDGLQLLMNALPKGTEIKLTDVRGVSKENGLEVKDSDLEDVGMKVIKTEVDEVSCCICFAQFLNAEELLEHYKQHELEAAPGPAPPPPSPPRLQPGGDALRCLRCRKVLQLSEWRAHWSRHWERDRRPLRCAVCEKAFCSARQILKHGLTHNPAEKDGQAKEKRFVCDLCPEGFVYMKYLLAHRTRAHPEAAGRALQLRCGECARVFAHLNSLRRHQRAHSGERNYLCNVCGKALSSREHLKFHIRIHTGYKPNVCKTCGKGFVKKCNLTLHERVHSGEKPHVCSHCGKAFSQRSTLVIHERYHSGARPYVCGLCGRGFVAKGLLSMHLKTTCI